MKALICDEPGRLSVIERPVPVCGANEVLVRIRHVGICGTDFHIYAGKHPFLEYPRVMGHELSGTVAEAPSGSTLKKGDPVYIVPYLSCGQCHACRKGLTNACQNIKVLGVHCDGGMAEYVSVPEQNVVPTGGIALADAAMIEFLAIGAHGVKRGSINANDRVLVTRVRPHWHVGDHLCQGARRACHGHGYARRPPCLRRRRSGGRYLPFCRCLRRKRGHAHDRR